MSEATKIYVATVDNHPLMRQGIKDIINGSGEFEVMMEATDGTGLIAQLEAAALLPDICILDTNTDYLHTLKNIRKRWRPIKVLIFSHLHSEFTIQEMMSNGANGYLDKTCSDASLMEALIAIYESDRFFAGELSKKVSDMQKQNMAPRISEREAEFLYHCCSDLGYKDIAELMGVSVRTVESFRDTLFSKFNMKTRTGLAMFALQNGIVPLRSPGGGD